MRLLVELNFLHSAAEVLLTILPFTANLTGDSLTFKVGSSLVSVELDPWRTNLPASSLRAMFGNLDTHISKVWFTRLS